MTGLEGAIVAALIVVVLYLWLAWLDLRDCQRRIDALEKRAAVRPQAGQQGDR